VDKFLNWKPIGKLLNQHLKKPLRSVGNPSYPSLKMFKVLLLQRWYNLSDRETDDSLTDRISFRQFTKFSFEYDTPDSSTICRFRNELIKHKLTEKLLDIINNQLESSKLIVKQGIIVDASIIYSSRRPRKSIDITQTSKNKDADDNPEIIYSEDIDAKWTVKANKPYYGYKIHMSTDFYHGFVTGGHTTSANRSDTKEIMPVIQESKVKKGTLILADKGYSSLQNRDDITKFGHYPGIMYKAQKNKPLNKLQKNINSKISSIRYIVERTFGTLKRGYGFYRSRYLGIAKTNGQFLLSAIAFNLKKASTFVS
jgi:IS5 family transposase